MLPLLGARFGRESAGQEQWEDSGTPDPASAEPLGTKRVNYIVKTKHGKIFVQVAHAVRGDKIIKAPAIFTYSPYSVLGVPPDQRRNNDASHWNPLGYHRVWADVVGTGNSGG